MALRDLFGLLAKRQTSPDKYLASSVNVVATGQHGAARQPFSQQRGISAFRSWIYAAASINANAVASTPLRLYAYKDAEGNRTRSLSRHRKSYLYGDSTVHPSTTVMRKAAQYGDDLEEVVGSHPLTDLLASANPFLNGFDLTVLRVLYGELTGNAYLHPIIDPASDLPAELWPLAPQFVEVIPDEDRFIDGYLYGIDSSRKQVFTADEVIHFRRPNPGNLLYGLGKVEASWGVVQANEAVHDMDLATFRNSARPDYAVVVQGTPTGDELDRFQRQVEERLRGTRKEGSFIAVTGDVQFTPLNFPPKDIAGREEIVEEIAAVFGVPVTMLKANDPNLASATSGFAQWREGTVLPLCRMDEEELNQTLLPMFGLEDTHCLAYDNPVPADKDFELRERQTAVAGGWRTPNEARIEEGREPIEDEMANALLFNGQPIGASVGFDLGAFGGPALPAISKPTETEEPIEEPTEVTPTSTEGVAPKEGLNGAQIASVVQVLDGIAGGSISPIAAVELIVAVGLSREQAEKMVNAQRDAKPEAAVEAEVEASPAPDVTEARKILDDYSQKTLTEYDAIKSLQAVGWTRKNAERAVKSQGKAIEDVDLKPTAEMAALAERGLKLREEHGRGGTEVGVARARDLKNRSDLSPETVKRMHSFFERHRVDLDAPAAKPGHDEYPSAGVIAWLLWGGDPSDPDGAGAGWARSKVEQLDRETEGKACDDEEKPRRTKAYEWPEEVAQMRLGIEGLVPDFDRDYLKRADSEGGDADDTDREESKTPAMLIADATETALKRVYGRLARAVAAGDLGGKKAPQSASIKEILADLTDVKGQLLKELTEAFDVGAFGGSKVGASRLNQILEGSGAGRINVDRISDALAKAMEKRAELIVESVIDGTVQRFVESQDATFSIQQETRRLEQSLQTTRARAEMIARTESANAYHAGQIDAWKQTDIVKQKHFLIAPGACQYCSAVSNQYGPGQKSLPIDEPMVKAGQTITGTAGGTMEVGIDSQGIVHPNCRCDFIPVLEMDS
jgi:HK97 family phage portal protein